MLINSYMSELFCISYSYLAGDGSAKKSVSRSGSKNSSRANTPGGSCNSKSLILMSVMKRLSRSAQRCSSSPQLSGGEASPLTTRRSMAVTPSGGSTGRRQRSRRSLAVSVAPDTPSVFTPRDTDTIDRCVLSGVSSSNYLRLTYCEIYFPVITSVYAVFLLSLCSSLPFPTRWSQRPEFFISRMFCPVHPLG